MKRRDFLKATAVGGAAAATLGTRVRRASAVPQFGDVPADHASIMVPKSQQVGSILECFMYGGIVPWEGFYCVPEFGSTTAKTWHKAYPVDFANASMACGYDPANPFTPFANDSGGRQIYLSPFLAPLIARADVVDRMRVVVNRHTLEPHEAAIPLTMSGKTLGSPSLASLGSHVARYFSDHDVDALHPSPFSYGFSIAQSFVPNDNILTMLATGLHPAAARPLHIKTDNAIRLNALLNRGAVGTLDDRARYDALLQIYDAQYQKRLQFGSSDKLLRAPRFGEFNASVSSLAHASDIQSMLAASYLTAVKGTACTMRGCTGDKCSATSSPPGTSVVTTTPFEQPINNPYMALRLATHLLTHDQFPAKHCMVVDTGLKEADGGGGYDTHSETPFTQARNMNNFFNSLLPMVNKPGENDPNKIDLNKTMIILNMEFGRTPGLQGGNTGRNHWPYGYTQIYIGGPAQKGVYGVIPENGQASTYTTPAENRIAALLALGIWPFDSASYSGSNVQNETLEGKAVQSVLKRVLGIQV